MNVFQKFMTNKFYLELTLASGLFIIAILTHSIMTFIIYMLYFIIFLEIVRAVSNYIREQRVMIKFLIDAFVILTLREFIVNVVKINEKNITSIHMMFNEAVTFNLIVLSIVILFLLFIRSLTSKIYITNTQDDDRENIDYK